MLRNVTLRILAPALWAGVAYGQVTISPSSLSLGSVAVGNTGTAKTATISNGMTAAIGISGLTAGTGGPFTIYSTTCGASLGAGKSCAISITFSPAAIGAASGALTAADTGTPASLSVALSGSGIYSVTLSPSSLSFGNVALGGSATKTVTLKNALNVPLAINSVS